VTARAAHFTCANRVTDLLALANFKHLSCRCFNACLTEDRPWCFTKPSRVLGRVVLCAGSLVAYFFIPNNSTSTDSRGLNVLLVFASSILISGLVVLVRWFLDACENKWVYFVLLYV